MKIKPSNPNGLPIDPEDFKFPRLFDGVNLIVFDNSEEFENYISGTVTSGSTGSVYPPNIGADGALSGRWAYYGELTIVKDKYFYTDSFTISSVSRIFINQLNVDGVDYSNILTSIENSVNSGKTLHLQLTKVLDNSIIGIYRISSANYVSEDGYSDIFVNSVLVGYGSLEPNEIYSISFQSSGPVGSTGPQGLTGPQGPTGQQGNSGNQGFQGPTGVSGNDGSQGSTGPQGFQGPTGVSGNNGSQGSTGPQGFQGNQGFQGPTGVSGNDGSQGSQGPQGPTGAIGQQGLTGPQGTTGPGTNVKTFGIVIDGGGSDITTGIKGDILIPYNMTITSWTLLGDQSGSIVIDLWKDTYVNYPPTILGTITGSEKPTLSSVSGNRNLSLSSWTTTISSGDIIRFNVDSCSGIRRVTLSVEGTIY